MKKLLVVIEGGIVQRVLTEGEQFEIEIINYDKDIPDDEAYEFGGYEAYYFSGDVSELYTDKIQKEVDDDRIASEKRLNS